MDRSVALSRVLALCSTDGASEGGVSRIPPSIVFEPRPQSGYVTDWAGGCQICEVKAVISNAKRKTLDCAKERNHVHMRFQEFIIMRVCFSF
jgi:hypothetical protein